MDNPSTAFLLFYGDLYYAEQKPVDIEGTPSTKFDDLIEAIDFILPYFVFFINIVHGLIKIVQDSICLSVYPLSIWERSG